MSKKYWMLPFILLLSGCEFFGQQEYPHENICKFERENVNLLIKNDDALGSEKAIFYGEESVLSAVNSENIDKLRMMLSQGASGDIEVHSPFEKNGKVPLIIRLISGNHGSDEKINPELDVIKTLIQGGVKINIADDDGDTPLHYAVANNNKAVVIELLKCGANPKILNNRGATPIFKAKTVDMINFSLKHKLGSIAEKNKWGNTLLHDAMLSFPAEIEKVKFLVDKINVDTVNNSGKSVLQYLLTVDSFLIDIEELGEVLVASGADVDLLDNNSRTSLINAIRREDLKTQFIELLIKSSKNISHRDKKNKSAVHYAKHNPFYLEVLSVAGIDLSNVILPNDERSSLLTDAAAHNKLAVVEYLLAKKVDVGAVDFTGRTALNYAIDNENHIMIKLLKEFKTPENSQVLIDAQMKIYLTEKNRPKNLIEAINKKNIDAVKELYSTEKELRTLNIDKAGIKAVSIGYIEGLEFLMDSGLDLEILDEGYSLLQNAVFYNQIEMAEFLIEQGLDPNYVNKADNRSTYTLTSNSSKAMYDLLISAGMEYSQEYDKNVVDDAINYDNYEMARLFISKGYSFNQIKYFDPDFLESDVIREQDGELLKFLIDQGFDINSQFTKLLTNGNLLFLAIKLNASDMIEPILQAGIDVNELIEGSSILAIAIESGRLEAIKLLLKYHPDIELNTMGEDTFMSKRNVLLQALEMKEETLAEYFISSDLYFDIHQLNTFNKNALHIASEEGFHELVSILITKGLNIDAKDTWGNTPLIYAANTGSLKVVKLLVEAGASVNARNNNGKTAEMLTSGSDKELIFQVLNKESH